MAPSLQIGIEAGSIVIKGAFNPAIFSPLWLERQGLIGTQEMDDSEIEIISRDLSAFRAGWLSVQVAPDGLQFATPIIDELDRLRDTAAGVLSALSHTPIASMGINRNFHLIMEGIAQLHAVGDALAPKSIWESTMTIPGMRSLTMWDARPDGYSGAVQVTVEPSARLPNAVYVGINDHFNLSRMPEGEQPSRDTAWDMSVEAETSADKIPVATNILSEEWAPSLQRAERFAQLINRLARQGS